MAQHSTTVRNAMLDAFETTIGTAPYIQFYNGTMPVDPQTAISSQTKLAEGQLPSDWLANASGGVKSKAGTWNATAVANGDATFARIMDTAKTNCHWQGLVAQAWAALTAYNRVGIQVVNGGNVYKVTATGTSAASGGPTGTGGSITDSGVTWAYVGPTDMTLDNVNFNTGQVYSQTTFSLTAGNA